MTTANTNALKIPDYQIFIDAIASLELPYSGSELHGMMCGYLCAGATAQGEAYLRALTANPNTQEKREGMLALFHLLGTSAQQISQMDFEFQLMLPKDDEPLKERAMAFSEWCDGFMYGLTQAGLDFDFLEDEEAKDAVEHISEFSKLDYENLAINEEDERALVEVNEYTRMAVLRIYSEIKQHEMHGEGTSGTKH